MLTGIPIDRAKHLLGLSVCILGFLPVVSGQQVKPSVTVADAICMTKLGGPSDEPAQFSQDGQEFVVLLKKGNLTQNTNEYKLLMWRTNRVFLGAKPEVLISMSSSSNRPAIRDVRWLDDNKTLVFLGGNPGEIQQIYSFDVSTHTSKQLTNSQTNIVSYAIASHGQQLLYAAERAQANFYNERAKRVGFIVSTQSVGDIVLGHKDASDAVYDGEVQFFLQPHSGLQKRLKENLLSTVQFAPPVMSPDGRYAVIVAVVDSIPQGWKQYLSPDIEWWTQHRRTPQPSGQRVFLFETMLLSTSTNRIRPLLNAPTSTSSHTEIAWSPDSRSVVVTNTYLPLAQADAKDLDTRRQTVFSAVEISVPGGEISQISQESLNSPAWLNSNRLVFRSGKSKWEHTISKVTFDKNGGHWNRVGEVAVEQTRPKIVVEENMNLAPRIIAIDPKTRQSAMLLDLNPQFADLRFADEAVIKWKGSDGHEVQGGLYYPVGYERGQRYPLVIQTHGFRSDAFWIDGPFTTAFAAQPLAGHGFMVLQMEEDTSGSDTPQEVDREVAGLEGAIEYLDQQGLIDRNRVGVIGFSRTCLHVKFALTHSKYHFAAASVTDGVDNGYFQYLVVNSRTGFDEAFEGSNGGLPFGEGLKSWMKRSPGFNADKVATPLLIFAPNPSSALFQWEWYAALKRLDKPVEMVVVADDEHELRRPWNRRISLQGNVDWFCFWLKGEEDPDPAKAAQYARWHEVRKLQEQNEKKSANAASSTSN